MDSQDLRKEKRRKLYYYLDVVRTDTNEVFGKLVDITTGGFLLTTEFPVADGKTLNLKIMFPQPMGKIDGIAFKATKMWSKPDANPQYNLIGFKTDGISDKDLKYIEYLIDRYSFHK